MIYLSEFLLSAGIIIWGEERGELNIFKYTFCDFCMISQTKWVEVIHIQYILNEKQKAKNFFSLI